jgi:hypothetical protein
MTTNAKVGGFTFKRQIAPSSPTVFTEVEEVFSISGLGQTNDLVDATHFGSGGNREYIPGLADGEEVSIECNLVGGAEQQSAFVDDVKNKVTNNFQVLYTASSPNVLHEFAAACISYVENHSVDGRNTITFTIKISGDIERT